jgi:hypothetical protein
MTILMPRAESPTIKVADIAYLRFGTFLALGLRARSTADLPTLAAAHSTHKSRRSQSPTAARSCGSRRCCSSPPL